MFKNNPINLQLFPGITRNSSQILFFGLNSANSNNIHQNSKISNKNKYIDVGILFIGQNIRSHGCCGGDRINLQSLNKLRQLCENSNFWYVTNRINCACITRKGMCTGNNAICFYFLHAMLWFIYSSFQFNLATQFITTKDNIGILSIINVTAS